MKGYILLLCAACMMLFPACSVIRSTVTSPDATTLNIHMDDLEFLGESELTVEFRTYLGVIRVIDRINGIPYDGKEIRTMITAGGLSSFGRLPSILKRSAYRLSEDFPEADYFIVVNYRKQKTNLFLGGEAVMSARVKAYRFR